MDSTSWSTLYNGVTIQVNGDNYFVTDESGFHSFTTLARAKQYVDSIKEDSND